MINWAKEARDLPPDPVTGTLITRLSGSSIRTENIYCDAPRATRDGTRLAALRYVDTMLSPYQALVCHDLTTKFTALIDAQVEDVPTSPAWGGSVYYRRGTTLMRASLETLETSPVFDLAGLPRCWQFRSVSPDERFLLYTGVVKDDPETYNIIRIDFREKTWKVLLEKGETTRLGAEYDPADGGAIAYGATFWEGTTRLGALLLGDAEGRNPRRIMTRAHHSAWIPGTRNFVGMMEFDYETMRHLPQYPDGELFVYSSDGTPPRLIPIPEHVLMHASVSRCGRYFVSEAMENSFTTCVMPIVVVNLQSGKYRTLVSDCRCMPAGDSGRTAKPYFTADNRHVIYTADPDGAVNVYAAGIPDGFLASLD